MRASALLLLLAVAGCSQGSEAQQGTIGEIPRNVRVLKLQLQDLEENLVITGPARPLEATDVSTQESGIISRILKDKGDAIRKGEVVVALDRDLLAAELHSATAERTLREYNEDRIRQLSDANSVSKAELLEAATLLENSKAHEEIARIRYERAAIKSPFAGMVTDRYVEPGELVAIGQRVARVVNPYTLKLVGAVSEREIRFIRPGAPALVSFDGSAGIAKGEVHWIGFEASPTTGKFDIEIRIDNADLAWRSGVVGRARVLKEIHGDVIAIPRDALIQRPGEVTVFVVEGEIAHERRVELGPDQGLMVLAITGLNAGDELVVRGQRELIDGRRVRVQERTDAADGSLPSDPDVVKQRGSASSEADHTPEPESATLSGDDS